MKILSTNTKGDSFSTAYYTYLILCKLSNDIELYGLGFRAPSYYGSGESAARIYSQDGTLLKSGPMVTTNANTYNYSNFDSPIILKSNTNYCIGLYGAQISNYDSIYINKISDDFLIIEALNTTAAIHGDNFGSFANKAKFSIDISFKYNKNKLSLINDGNNICITSNEDLIIKDPLPFTIDKFNNYGMDDLSKINSIAINKTINNKFNIAILK